MKVKDLKAMLDTLDENYNIPEIVDRHGQGGYGIDTGKFIVIHNTSKACVQVYHSTYYSKNWIKWKNERVYKVQKLDYGMVFK